MNSSCEYDSLMAQAIEWMEDGNPSRARSCRLSAARLLGNHKFEDWESMLAKADGVCNRCGCKASTLVKDHIMPIYAGGSDGIENIQPLCIPCNSQKGRERINWLKVRGLSI